MDAKIETETQDIATEIDNKINQFMIDSNLPESLKPYVKAAAWIGASIGVKDCAKAIS